MFVEYINIKNRTYYFFDDIIKLKEFDPNNIKFDKKLYKNILIYYVTYVTIKDRKYVKINTVNTYVKQCMDTLKKLFGTRIWTALYSMSMLKASDKKACYTKK